MPRECWIHDNQGTSIHVDMQSPLRRIEDRIRALHTRAICSADSERENILQELLQLVHELTERLRNRAAKVFLKGELFYERRGTDAKQSGASTDSSDIRS